jgi:hypothetical protein
MKIYQIISEAPSVPAGYTTSAGGIAVPAQVAAQQTAATQAQKQAATAQKVAAQKAAQQAAQQAAAQKAATRKGRVDTVKTMAYNKENPIKGKLYQKLGIEVKGKLTAAEFNQLRAKALETKKFNQTALGKWQGKFGNTVRTALGALQLAGSCIELYTVRAAADEYEAEGLLSPENSQIMRDYALRKFTVEVAAQIALWAASAVIARGLVIVVRALMLTFGIATGGAGLAALVASEIAMQAFLAYIKTEDGREVFARYLAGVLIDDDSMIGSSTGKILDYIGLSTKVPGQPKKTAKAGELGSGTFGIT